MHWTVFAGILQLLVEIVDVEEFDAVPIVENCLIERVCHTNIILAQRN
ncbi:hypothetical protein [Xanthomonas populi]|nr:hypothetical protein [Xanthomonas populi]